MEEGGVGWKTGTIEGSKPSMILHEVRLVDEKPSKYFIVDARAEGTDATGGPGSAQFDHGPSTIGSSGQLGAIHNVV